MAASALSVAIVLHSCISLTGLCEIIKGLTESQSGLTHEMYIPTYQFGNTLTMCFRSC